MNKDKRRLGDRYDGRRLRRTPAFFTVMPHIMKRRSDSIVLFDEMTSNDVEDWDSLSHINLISDIEANFGITFTTDEIMGTKNVGEFIRVIESKL